MPLRAHGGAEHEADLANSVIEIIRHYPRALVLTYSRMMHAMKTAPYSRSLASAPPRTQHCQRRVPIPIEGDPTAIRSILWYQTDKKYKKAIEELTTVGTNNLVKVEQEDKSADVSKEPASRRVDSQCRYFRIKLRKTLNPLIAAMRRSIKPLQITSCKIHSRLSLFECATSMW